MSIRVLGAPEPLGSPAEAVHVAIGVFDGVHLGHAAVVGHTLEQARRRSESACVVTFDRHPNSVVAPDHAPAMIYPLWRRIQALGQVGMPAALVCAFDDAFSRQTGDAFVRWLMAGFGRLASVTVGAGFVFGHRRSGDVDLLRRLGEEGGFSVHALEPRILEGDVVSSTRIRELISAGEFAHASSALGRTYGICGEVVEGDRRGRQLGFPTANVDAGGLALPPHGVYAAKIFLRGCWYEAAVNIGRRPTVNGDHTGTRVEAHLLDFAGDLYGQRMEVLVGRRLRGEVKFGSVEALKAQIRQDVETVREWSRQPGNMGLP